MTPVVLGRIAGLFGVTGWLRIYSHTEPREAVLEYRNWLLKRGDSWQPMKLEEGKTHGKSIVAKLAGIDDRDTASALLGVDIAVPRERLPETRSGEYYWADLEGLEIVHRDGRPLGKVARLMATGANDVLVVDGDREYLIPFIMDEVILNVDLGNGRISVDWEWD